MKAMRSNRRHLALLAGLFLVLAVSKAKGVGGGDAYVKGVAAVKKGDFTEAGKQFDVYLAWCSQEARDDPQIPFALVSGIACHLVKGTENNDKAREYARRLLAQYSVPGTRAGMKAREGFLALVDNKCPDAAFSFSEAATLIAKEKPSASMVKRLAEARLWRCICLSFTGRAGLEEAFSETASLLRDTDPAERIHQEAICVMKLLRTMPASEKIAEICGVGLDEDCLMDVRDAAIQSVDDLIGGPCRFEGLMIEMDPVDIFVTNLESLWETKAHIFPVYKDALLKTNSRESEEPRELSPGEVQFRQGELLLKNGDFPKAESRLFDYVKANEDRSYGWIGRRGQALGYLMSCALKDRDGGKERAVYYARELLETLLVSEPVDRGKGFNAFDLLLRGKPFQAARAFGRLADEAECGCPGNVNRERVQEIMLWKGVCMVCMENEYALREAYDLIDAMLAEMAPGCELATIAGYVGASAAGWAGDVEKMNVYLHVVDGRPSYELAPRIVRSIDHLLQPRLSMEALFAPYGNAVELFLEEMDQEMEILGRTKTGGKGAIKQSTR